MREFSTLKFLKSGRSGEFHAFAKIFHHNLRISPKMVFFQSFCTQVALKYLRRKWDNIICFLNCQRVSNTIQFLKFSPYAITNDWKRIWKNCSPFSELRREIRLNLFGAHEKFCDFGTMNKKTPLFSIPIWGGRGSKYMNTIINSETCGADQMHLFQRIFIFR